MGARTKRRTRRQANQNKTTATKRNVKTFLASIDDEQQRQDTATVLELMARVTGDEPTMWGSSIVGFGQYHYTYASGREGDFFLTGVSPRKANLTLYIMPGFAKLGPLLNKLGKHKTARSCLYIKRLEDVDLGVLETLVARSVDEMRRMYPG